MPVIYRCRVCNSELYLFEKVGQDFYGLPTPSELAVKLGGKCPKCRSELKVVGIEDIKLPK